MNTKLFFCFFIASFLVLSINISPLQASADIQVRLEIDHPSYLIGEIFKIRIYLINNNDFAVPYPNTFEYYFVGGPRCIVLGSYGVDFCSTIPNRRIPPRSEVQFWYTCKYKAKETGTYTLVLKLYGEHSISFRVFPDPDLNPRIGRFLFY